MRVVMCATVVANQIKRIKKETLEHISKIPEKICILIYLFVSKDYSIISSKRYTFY